MNLFAIIITFNPNLNSLKSLVDSLNEQNAKIIIVDNCSDNLLDIKVFFNETNIIYLSENKGIAAAQNIGIQHVVDNGGDYILFFDQDSSIPEGYIGNIIDDYRELVSQGKKVGIIGPRFIDERFGFYYKTVNINKKGFRKKIDVSDITQPKHSALLISSGSLVSINTLNSVGLMRENYFIDYVDTEWCIRAASLGYKNYVSAQAVMQHTIGDNVLQFRYFNVPVHSPFRRYYRVRNAYYMYREPHVPKLLALREILFNFVHQLILILFLSKKSEYIKSYAKGVKDGLFNYKGHNDD